MKHIDIINNAKVNGEWIKWVATIPAKHLKTWTVDGVAIVTTDRNYYLDTKKMKIRYRTENTDNASYDYLTHVYLEFYPGMFAPFGVATENNITQKLQDAAKAAKTIGQDKADEIRNSLVRIGK